MERGSHKSLAGMQNFSLIKLFLRDVYEESIQNVHDLDIGKECIYGDKVTSPMAFRYEFFKVNETNRV